MTFPAVVVTLGVWVVLACLFVFDDAIDRRRRERRELRRCGRVTYAKAAPRWTADPSPRPRLSDFEWRAIAEGDTQR